VPHGKQTLISIIRVFLWLRKHAIAHPPSRDHFVHHQADKRSELAIEERVPDVRWTRVCGWALRRMWVGIAVYVGGHCGVCGWALRCMWVGIAAYVGGHCGVCGWALRCMWVGIAAIVIAQV
jgi:hypothetical protein